MQTDKKIPSLCVFQHFHYNKIKTTRNEICKIFDKRTM